MIGALHEKLVHQNRVRTLASAIATLLPADASALDVGCGDGELDRQLAELRPDLQIQGIDVLIREGARVPVRAFDGERLPDSDDSFDVVLLVDVLHHTPDPVVLLKEARTSGPSIRDHQGSLSGWTPCGANPAFHGLDWQRSPRRRAAVQLLATLALAGDVS